MRSKYALFILLALSQGCSTISKHSSHPNCPSATQNPASADEVLGLWECGKKEQARRIAYEGALSGDKELAISHMQFLAAENNMQSGLIFAIKGAEQGDIEMAKWVLRIDKTHHSTSLQALINEWFYKYFKRPDQNVYINLDEFLDYSIEQSKRSNYSSAPYAIAFSKRISMQLSPEESTAISQKTSTLMKGVDGSGNQNRILTRSAEILNNLADTEI